jgi:LytS/YehU family sensor histidine kinase
LWLRGIPLHLLTGILSSALVAAFYGVFRAVQYGGQTWWQGAIANMTRAAGVGNYVQTTVIYGLVAGAMFAIYSSRLRRQRDEESATLLLRTAQLEGQLTSAQLHALQTQLQPHFLFNALNSVASLVEQQRNDEAFHMIGLIGELLRATLDRSRGSTLPLCEEVDLLNRYLEIERVRFPQRLSCHIDIDDECWQSVVPTLLLQPVLENSIRHAVNRDPNAGSICIRAHRHGNNLLLLVQDDGPGLPADWDVRTSFGIGLNNVAQRLRVHFGDDQRLDIDNVEPHGVAVRMQLPFQTIDQVEVRHHASSLDRG